MTKFWKKNSKIIIEIKIKISINLENFKFWDQICPRRYDWQKFSVRLKKSRLWDHISPKNMNDKTFEKINIKFEIKI